MTDMDKKDKTSQDYEKPELAELGDDQGELSENDLGKVSGGAIEGSEPCHSGSQADICSAGGSGNTPVIV